MQHDINDFIARQLAAWPEAAQRFAALDSALSRSIDIPGRQPYSLMFNPARIVSSAARTDAASIASRPCFLCSHNRPAAQMVMPYGDYEILVNPFPIFPGHLTIPSRCHTPQAIEGRAADMARLALALQGFTLFYNGARCGASAPDHFHFQAAPSSHLPLRADYHFLTFRFTATPANAESMTQAALARARAVVNSAAKGADGSCSDDPEPPVNILCSAVTGSDSVEFVVIPRRAHRPANFGSGPGQLLMSPPSADLAGTLVAPRREEFDRLDTPMLLDLFNQLCFPHE